MVERVEAHVDPDADYFVEIERAYLRDDERLTGCALADFSNLQILPDGTAYRCGLLVDDGAMASLRFTGGELLLDAMGGEERMTHCSGGCSSCPAVRSAERRACIYDKISAGGARVPIAVGARSSAHRS